MATEEDPGMMRQLLSQEMAAHQLSPKDQTYLAALMPVLQAAGHDQSGARLTTAQIRQNVESLLPMGADNKENLAQVRANRSGFYQGLLTQAGGANLHAPQNEDLLADQQKSVAGKGATPSVGTVVRGFRYTGGDPSKQSSWTKL
jgi:hypothetical protein